jgi:hypothetical protein
VLSPLWKEWKVSKKVVAHPIFEWHPLVARDIATRTLLRLPYGELACFVRKLQT